MYSLVFYSHSDYSDCWRPMFQQTDKYFGDEVKKYLFCDKEMDSVPNDWNVVKYDDNNSYQNRVISCLDQLPSDEVIIFHHEDMFLYDSPNKDFLYKCYEHVKNDEVNFLKLCKAAYRDEPAFEKFKNIFYSPYDLMFAIQPTFCKVKYIKELYQQTPGENIWKFEANSNITCIKNSFISCYSSFKQEGKRGAFHWDSLAYPYFATAIVKGLWNTEDYPELLNKFIEEYNIDLNIRGKNG